MKARRMGRPLINIGTSGWSYPHWKGSFYPHDLRTDQYLAYYARQFATVEINNTFYRLPAINTLRRWRETVPPTFIFSVKASRYISHVKRLAHSTRSLSMFSRRLETLGPTLGPILFQLPPRWRFDGERLASFLKLLGRAHRAVFEFRDPTWFCNKTYDLLAEHGAAFCIYDLAGMQSPRVVTANFVYIRLHGPDGPYRGRYRRSALRRWADASLEWAGQGRMVYCYFDNDERGYAAHDALCLRRMLGEHNGL